MATLGGNGIMREKVFDNIIKLSQWHYASLQECYISADGETYTTYSLLVQDWFQEHWRTLQTIHDIALNPKVVEELASKFNLMQLSPIHIFDALEDFLP